MSLKNRLGVALTAAALASSAQACNDEHPTLCSINAHDDDGHALDVIRDQDGNIVATPCQCETEDKPEKPQYYAVGALDMPATCAAEINAMIDREVGNATGGTGGSTNNPTCYPSAEVCDGYDNDCDGQVDEGCGNQPTCTPTTEVCDGYDNDCDGYVDEGNVCDSGSTGKKPVELCWPVAHDSVDPNSYIGWGWQTATSYDLYCEDMISFNDSYPNQSATWIIRDRSDKVYGDHHISANGPIIGAAMAGGTANAEPFMELNTGNVVVSFNGENGPGIIAFSTDNNLSWYTDGQSTMKLETKPDADRPNNQSNKTLMVGLEASEYSPYEAYLNSQNFFQ